MPDNKQTLDKPDARIRLRPLSNELSRITVTYRSPTELTVPPNNPRFHPPRQIKQIARSISTFGFLLPIVVDEADRVLVGIGRLLAARDLGYTEVPTIQVSHLSEAQKKAFAIAGYEESTLEQRFGGMLHALSLGAPPHGGIAPGIDRIVMLLCGEENLREVVLFPMNQRAEDLMMGAPSDVSPKQLRELHIRVVKPE